MNATATAPQTDVPLNDFRKQAAQQRSSKSKLAAFLVATVLLLGAAYDLAAQCVQFVNCPSNRVEYACFSNCVPVNFTVTATNYCNPTNLLVITDYPSGYCFPQGTTTIHSTAYGSGQSNTCSFTVTVLSNCPPPTPCIDLHCPTNTTFYVCNSDCFSLSHPPYTLWATDLCTSNQVSITTTPAFPYCFPLGTTWVTATATSGGQSAQCSFPVTVLPDPNCNPNGCTNCNTGCSTNLLVNGSFENPGVPDGYIHLFGGNPLLPGWTPVFDGVDYYNPVVAPASVNTGFAADGVYLLNLATRYGTNGGGIKQTFATIPGRSYRVSFAMGTSLERGRRGTASLTVTVAGMAQAFNVSTENPSITWTRKEFSFVANSTSATLVFATMDDPWQSFVNLDDVRVSDCCTDPGLKIKSTITVEWNCGILQSAPEVSGPYTDVPGATSPYTTTATGLQRYFRTR